jgi:hypothetical protein
MKTFYLLRHSDVHGHSGLGVVAEGVIFDTGHIAMTWLSKWMTITTFENVRAVHELHSHGGRTEIVIERTRGHGKKFEACREEAKLKKSKLRKAKC